MIIPIRCFTCGKLVADKWEEFIRRVRQGESPDVVMTSLKITRYCCRRMLLSHINLIDDILPFSQHT
ncbi:MAG: DNA-directed RNA polymerase subunit N [Candidatus Jordarchaeaceae archaeon]